MNKILNIGFKVLGVGLVTYSIGYGLIVRMPLKNPIWGQTARNVFYHVPMWFAEIVLMTMSVIFSIQVLRALDPDRERVENPLYLDIKAKQAATVGVLFNILGLITGITWQRVTWGENLPNHDITAWWAWDPIQVCALVALLIYGAYFLLRSSFTEAEQRARIAAVYNIFAFATLIPLFFIVPKMFEGLHPTANQGSFVVKGQVDNTARLVLYPGMLGFILMGVWVWEVRSRWELLKLRFEDFQAEAAYRQDQLTQQTPS